MKQTLDDSKFHEMEKSKQSLEDEIQSRFEIGSTSTESDLRKKLIEDWSDEKSAFEQQLQEKSEKI